MGNERVELVRRAFEAASRRPKPDFATVNALYHPDHELVTPLSRLEGTTYSGAAGFGKWLRNMNDDWEGLTVRVDRVASGASE